MLPDGVDWPSHEPGVLPAGPQRGMVVNETDLPDDIVHAAVETYFEENASMLGVNAGNTFQHYANEGSLLARTKFRVPANTIEEICLARDIAERDDDVGATMGAMLAIAFGDGMKHVHEDEVTIALFDEVGKHAGMDAVVMEMYRELLIASQVTTVNLFTRENFPFKPQGADRARTRSLAAPLIGVIPSEQIRVLDDDLFGKGTLAYKPATGAQEVWLKEFFSPLTHPARKNDMRHENPVLAALMIEQRIVTGEDSQSLSVEAMWDPAYGNEVYVLNPRMVSRSTFPKGSWKYPRPLLTRNFGLLEAKRLLNLMDYALLQGGSNFLVVAKKGDKDARAMPEELVSLRETIRRASRSGVIIGDHRLNIEIITPDLTELLNPSKRKLLGRRIAMGLLRLPEYAEADAGAGQAVLSDTEIIGRVISSDRRYVRRHLEQHVYGEVVKRNQAQFPNGPAGIWFPKIILQGTQYFTDMVLKLRDRGDISRHSTVAVAGFDYEAEVQARKREKPDDRIMTAPVVPFSGAQGQGGPQDNQGGGGRPPGGSSNNGLPGSAPPRSTKDNARPRQLVQRNAGETVRAMYDETAEVTYFAGEVTAAIVEQYDDASFGRVTPAERAAMKKIEKGAVDLFTEKGLHVIPVNLALEEVGLDRVLRLTPGLSLIVGTDHDHALVARALCFRSPDYSALQAQEAAIAWGYDPTPVGD